MVYLCSVCDTDGAGGIRRVLSGYKDYVTWIRRNCRAALKPSHPRGASHGARRPAARCAPRSAPGTARRHGRERRRGSRTSHALRRDDARGERRRRRWDSHARVVVHHHRARGRASAEGVVGARARGVGDRRGVGDARARIRGGTRRA